MLRTILISFSAFLLVSCFNRKEETLSSTDKIPDDRAYIKKVNNSYTVTLVGERKLMSHDPISLLKRRTHVDSITLEIPNSNGIVKCTDIIASKTNFKFIEGNISFTNKSLLVKLFYFDPYFKKINAFSWNGDYLLKSRD